MQPLVIRDNDLCLAEFTVAAMNGLDAKLLCLANRLRSNSKRRQIKDAAVCVANDVLSPNKLHRRLA
jgi:hypothetical protein